MILKIFNNGNAYCYTPDSTFFITRSYGGEMSLQFDISQKHKIYKYLVPEAELEYNNQRYLLKGINERKTVTTINAILDFTGLTEIIYENFKSTTDSFYNVCQRILLNTGWSIVNAELISKRTTLDLTDVTALDILNHCTNSTAYNTCYRFDTLNKVIHCIKPENNTTPTGMYFTDELNLTEITYKGSSSSLVTRLYIYGKDGLDISSVNGGIKYIENHTYTDKIISAVWRDERYTDAQELLDDGKAKLSVMAVPEQSYTAKVIDLAKIKPEFYGNILKYDLYDVVTLVDRNRKTRINHRIVEIKEYPENPLADTVAFSTVPSKLSGKLTEVKSRVNELNAQQLHDRIKVNEIKQDLDTTVLHVSEAWANSENKSLLTQTAEGLCLEVDKVVGTERWSTLLQQSATDVCIAWNNISEYIKFENSELNIYNTSNVKLMKLSSTGQEVYDSEGIKLMSLNSKGQDFFYKGNRVGWIGTGYYQDDINKRDLSFNLENGSAFMSWAYKSEPDESSYTMKFTYAAEAVGSYEANQLHCGCDLNLHGHTVHNANFTDFYFDGGTITGTWEGNIVTSFNTDGTAATWRSFSLTFKNGILQKASW